MDLANHYKVQLERYQFQMGAQRGRLAVTLDVLTDAMALIGQHGVYCRTPGRSDQETLDIRTVLGQLEGSKSLILETMQDLRTGSGE